MHPETALLLNKLYQCWDKN